MLASSFNKIDIGASLLTRRDILAYPFNNIDIRASL